MANLYVGSDGVIHSGTGNGVNGAVSINTRTGRESSDNSSANSTYYNNVSYVSGARKVFFWLFAIAAGITMGIWLYNLVGAEIFKTYDAESTTEIVENWFWTLAPWVFAIGGCAGSISYGVFCAGDRNYDLMAFVFAAISAVGGIIVMSIALVIICFIVVFLMYIIGISIGIMLVIAIIVGVCNS